MSNVIQFPNPKEIVLEDEDFTLHDVIEFTMEACDFTECISIGRNKDGEIAIVTSDTYGDAIDLMNEALRLWTVD